MPIPVDKLPPSGTTGFHPVRHIKGVEDRLVATDWTSPERPSPAVFEEEFEEAKQRAEQELAEAGHRQDLSKWQEQVRQAVGRLRKGIEAYKQGRPRESA